MRGEHRRCDRRVRGTTRRELCIHDFVGVELEDGVHEEEAVEELERGRLWSVVAVGEDLSTVCVCVYVDDVDGCLLCK